MCQGCGGFDPRSGQGTSENQPMNASVSGTTNQCSLPLSFSLSSFSLKSISKQLKKEKEEEEEKKMPLLVGKLVFSAIFLLEAIVKYEFHFMALYYCLPNKVIISAY